MSMMTINKQLNLVLSLPRGNTFIYVYSTPISKEVFDANFLIISKTFTELYTQGLGLSAAPRIAAKMMRKIALEDNIWDGPEGVQNVLMQEIFRLTNVFLPGERGWESIPLHTAIVQKQIDDDEMEEVENSIVYFIVAYVMHRRQDREQIINATLKLWGGQLTSLNFTEYRSSLTTSTTDEIIPQREVSSVAF
jgi:hypothetical protein